MLDQTGLIVERRVRKSVKTNNKKREVVLPFASSLVLVRSVGS